MVIRSTVVLKLTRTKFQKTNSLMIRNVVIFSNNMFDEIT